MLLTEAHDLALSLTKKYNFASLSMISSWKLPSVNLNEIHDIHTLLFLNTLFCKVP